MFLWSSAINLTFLLNTSSPFVIFESFYAHDFFFSLDHYKFLVSPVKLDMYCSLVWNTASLGLIVYDALCVGCWIWHLCTLFHILLQHSFPTSVHVCVYSEVLMFYIMLHNISICIDIVEA